MLYNHLVIPVIIFVFPLLLFTESETVKKSPLSQYD